MGMMNLQGSVDPGHELQDGLADEGLKLALPSGPVARVITDPSSRSIEEMWIVLHHDCHGR